MAATDVLDGRSLTAGAVGGIAAYLVGYAITFVWHGSTIEDAIDPINVIARLFGQAEVPAWKIVGWLYYSAHFVDTSLQFGPIGPTTVDLIGDGGGSLESLYFLPPIVLLVAGAIVAIRVTAATATGPQIGATVVVGYVISAIVGVFVFRIGANGPALIPAVVIAGIIYPIVFGAIGGFIAQQIRS